MRRGGAGGAAGFSRPWLALAAAGAVFLMLSPVRAASLEELQRLEWSDQGARFGGMSGLLVEGGGTELTAVTDHGALWQGDAIRGDDGRIAGVTWRDMGDLRDSAGDPVRDFRADSEDLTRGQDGMLYVSFEHYTRVNGFTPPDLKPVSTHPWDRFKAIWNNESFESLATLPDGRLIAVVEKARDGGYRTFVQRGGNWDEAAPIPAGDGDYAATGAAVGPDGRFYLLERRVTMFMSFGTRVRRFAVSPGGWDEGEVLLETASGDLPNMEGISVWSDPRDGTIVSLISDNGFRGAATVLAEFRLREQQE